MRRRTKPLLRSVALAVLAALAGPAVAAPPVQPEFFAPGFVAGPGFAASPSFTPDAKTVFFDLYRGNDAMILVAHRDKDRWTKPEIALFSGQWLDRDTAMAPDGSFLVFVSNRPAAAGGKPIDLIGKTKTLPAQGGNLWRVDRQVAPSGESWGEPVRLPDAVNRDSRTFSPSVVGDGSLYFTQPEDGEYHIFRSSYRDGAYQPPVRQLVGGPAGHQTDPSVAPDDSFIVFDAGSAGTQAPDRMFIAFREGDHWGTPVDLGAEVNDGNPWGPHLGPDQHTLYFNSERTQAITYPRTPDQAHAALSENGGWNSGVDGIWGISLAPWLDAHRGK